MNKCVLGNGYIGSAFKNAGYDCIDRNQLEFYTEGNIHLYFLLSTLLDKYDIIINCIGITDTRWTELPINFAITFDVNAQLVRVLAEYCKNNNKKLVHISTGDLYGNQQIAKKNIETSTSLDANTNYRLSKLAAERFCNPNDLILRIRLPFDNRKHPKNLLVKCQNYKKFYAHPNSYSYVPDIIHTTEKLLLLNQSGVFNVAQPQHNSLLGLVKLITTDEKILNLQDYLVCDEIIRSLDLVHVHNIMNTKKVEEFVKLLPLEYAWQKSYEEMN